MKLFTFATIFGVDAEFEIHLTI